MLDGYLLGLLTAVNEGSAPSRVLLCVGGLVITGTLMSAQDYRAALSAAGGADAIAALDRMNDEWKVARAGHTPSMADTLRESQPRLVYLRNAAIAGHAERLALWHGRVESVDGWSLLPTE